MPLKGGSLADAGIAYWPSGLCTARQTAQLETCEVVRGSLVVVCVVRVGERYDVRPIAVRREARPALTSEAVPIPLSYTNEPSGELFGAF